MHHLWSAIKRFFGMDYGWNVMTFARVAVDPVSARELTRVLQPVPTIRLRPEPAVTVHADHQPPFTWHGITDAGLMRTQNEDCLAMLDLGRSAFFAVADGMGGHDAGEVASRIAVDTVSREMHDDPAESGDPLALVAQSIRAANTAVKQAALRKASNMGTTLTTALVIGKTAYVGSVGDSRAYWIGDGSITQITRDHSLVARLVEAGRLSKEDARTDLRSNLLFRNIGSVDAVEVDVFRVPLSGGILLLCSDGLWGELGDDEIRNICTEEERTEVMCARLVQQANANGGKDNITAIVVKVA